jgi:hypothetical protein
MPTHTGTHHFRTQTDAQRYYATYGETLADVLKKIKEGAIAIGPPLGYDTTLSATYVNKEGRYVLVTMSADEARANVRYKVKKFRENTRGGRTIHRNLTLAEAVAYCSGPASIGTEAGNRWSYGREKE